MKLRYYAEADTGVDHRRTLELLESISEEHAIPVEVHQVDPQVSPPADFAGATDQRSLDDAWDDFTYNPTLQDGLGGAPSSIYGDPEDIVGNVGIVVDGDLVWATRFWGTHHGWGPVDPEDTAIGFLEEVEARGTGAIAERVPIDDWSPTSDDATDTGPTDGDGSGSSVPDGVRKPTRDAIRDICTAQSFQRGVRYFEDGRVRDVSLEGSTVEATVLGSREYRTTVDLAADRFDGWCSCPYDYAGDCKHIVAVLLTVAERYDELIGSASTDATAERSPSADAVAEAGTGDDIEEVIAEADAESLRTFLRDVLRDDEDLRERFLATVGRPVEKSVADYKREVDLAFENAAGRRGIVEYDTHIDFGEYYDLAETYRENGDFERALDIYRALAEAIRENLDRVDDSSGHYGQAIERAIGAYADCLRDADLESDARREHIDYLFEQYRAADFVFVQEDYDDALREVCERTEDLEYLLSLLRPHVPTDEATAVDPTAGAEVDAPDDRSSDDASASGTSSDSETETATEDATTESDSGDGSRPWRPDPTPGPLEPDLFTGDAIDIDRLNAGPLEAEDFTGGTLATKLAEARPDEEVDGDGDGGGGTAESSQTRRPDTRNRLSGSERTVLSTYLWVLSELDDRDALRAVLEDVYTERTEFYRQYVDVLVSDGQEDRAREVIEDGLEEFSRSADVHRLAADFYRDRDDERYRELLQRLFVRFGDYDAYDELQDTCSDAEWDSVFHRIVTQLGRLDPDRLIDLYIHEDEHQKAFEKVLDSDDLNTLRQHRAAVADLDPERYFEAYRERLEPYLAAETGRDHYRTVIEHLRELEQLGVDEGFEAFLAHLKEKHSNRPALLDELEKAGF